MRRLEGALIRTSSWSGKAGSIGSGAWAPSSAPKFSRSGPEPNSSSRIASCTFTLPESTGASSPPPSVSSASTSERMPSGKRSRIAVPTAVTFMPPTSYPCTSTRPPKRTVPDPNSPVRSSSRMPAGSKTIPPSMFSSPCGNDRWRSRPPSSTASPVTSGCWSVPPISATSVACPELRTSGKNSSNSTRPASPLTRSASCWSPRPISPVRSSAVPSPANRICSMAITFRSRAKRTVPSLRTV